MPCYRRKQAEQTTRTYGFPLRACAHCGKDIPRKNYPPGHYSRLVTCSYKCAGAIKTRPPEEKKLTRQQGSRQYSLRVNYGITIEEYDEVVTHQGGGCAACGHTYTGHGRRLAVDHDHQTGVTRGMLCPMCNRGMSFFKDNPDALEAAAAYLRNPPAVAVLGERIGLGTKPKKRRRKRRKR